MVVPPSPQRLILPVAPLIAGAVGIFTAGIFALIPTDLLEQLVIDSGLASVLSAAEPPLGFTARLALILVCGGGVALVAWFALFLALGTRTILVQRPSKSGVDAPVLRRADAHPDAPARRPIFANTDLGTPFHEVRAKAVHLVADPPAPPAPPVEQPLPVDLDQPLASFDPAAMPEEPLDWFPPPAQLKQPIRRQTFDPGERFETFPLTPMVREHVRQADPAPQPAPPPAPPRPRADPSETIHALLDRLERVAGRRDPVPPPPAPPHSETIEDTLVALRRMAGGR